MVMCDVIFWQGYLGGFDIHFGGQLTIGTGQSELERMMQKIRRFPDVVTRGFAFLEYPLRSGAMSSQRRK